MKDKMAYFNGRALFNGIAISYLFLHCGSSFWIAEIIGTIFGVILLTSLKNVNNYKATKIITGIAISIMCLTVIINMGHSLYLKNTPLWLLTLVPIITCEILSKSKVGPLKKTVFIIFVYSMFLFFLKIVGLYPHIDIDEMRPLFNTDVMSILWGSVVFTLVGTVPIVSLNDISDKKNTIINYLVSMLSVMVISFLAISVLGLKEITLYRYPEYVVLKRIEFLNFVSNVDNIFNFAILADLILTMSAGIKNIGNISKHLKYAALIIVAFVSYYMCYLNWPLLFLYRYFPFILIFLLIIIIIPKKSQYKKS